MQDMRHSKPHSKVTRRLAVALPAICLALLLPGCATNPATGDTDIVLMSEKQEIKLGREAHEKMMAEGAAYEDEKVQAYVDRIGQDLAKNSDRPDISYTFTVIDNENINAFALPGGYIYINRGLMIYMETEAELAAVLSHEIGHVTARHAVRQQTANAANSVLAQLAYATTRSSDLAQASNMYGTSLVRGYGREHELEADSEGAAYLHNTGYDPNALLEVIGVLKDQEQYNRVKAQTAGKKPQAYHGLFATHPRNDRRLQQVIRTASELPPAENPRQPDPVEFREMMEGLAYGKSSTSAQREEDRFYHNKLGFTFAYPEGWIVDRGSKSIVARRADDGAKITLTMQRADKTKSARVFLDEKMNAPKLFQSEPLSQAGLNGHTGVTPATGGEQPRRVAVLTRGGLSYMFDGEVADLDEFTTEDAHFLEIIESFRPMKKSEREGKKQQYVHWIQADSSTTYASLARQVRIPDAENQLRLMNGHYPSGEPRPGDWIKVIKQDN
jgi:predicted Zn-dependent protease